MKNIPSSLFRLLGGIIVLLLMNSCASFKLSTMHYDPLYGPEEVVLEVPSDVKIDTLSFSQLRWKLRTDNTFRWNYAQYAMNQPLSWYNSNFRYSYWRPFNSFDVYWNRHNFWYDWAFNYPFQWGWSWNRWGYWNSWNRWNRPFYHWDSWYHGPWHNPSYNVIWNSSRQNTNIAYVRGGRGSRFIDNGNSNIENTISRRYNNPRNNVNNNNNVIDNIVNDLRSNGNRVRVYDNPNNVPNNNVIRYNNGRPVVPNNNSSNSRINHNWNNSNNNSNRIINSRPPVYNNSSSRGSSSGVISGGSSRGSSGGVSRGGSSGGSSRGSRNPN